MIARLISICSVALLGAFSAAQSDAEWIERANELDTGDRAAVRSFLNQLSEAYEASNDSALKRIIAEQKSALDSRRRPDLELIISRLEVRQSFSEKGSATAGESAQDVLANKVYRDSEEPARGNWLTRALERLADLFTYEIGPDVDVPESRRINVQPIAYVLLGILIIGIIALFAFALRGWRLGKTEKAGLHKRAILDEDEPDRTLDEWLLLADKLQAEGRFREVVRCLYVAVLLRLDAARIIRFERSETNWEHLARIEISSAPSGIEYRNLTKKFDVIWYGGRPASVEDCVNMRAQYEELSRLLKERA